MKEIAKVSNKTFNTIKSPSDSMGFVSLSGSVCVNHSSNHDHKEALLVSLH